MNWSSWHINQHDFLLRNGWAQAISLSNDYIYKPRFRCSWGLLVHGWFGVLEVDIIYYSSRLCLIQCCFSFLIVLSFVLLYLCFNILTLLPFFPIPSLSFTPFPPTWWTPCHPYPRWCHPWPASLQLLPVDQALRLVQAVLVQVALLDLDKGNPSELTIL